MASSDKSQWAQTGIHKEKLSKRDETREHVAPRGSGVCIGGIQIQTGNGSGATCLSCPSSEQWVGLD